MNNPQNFLQHLATQGQLAGFDAAAALANVEANYELTAQTDKSLVVIRAADGKAVGIRRKTAKLSFLEKLPLASSYDAAKEQSRVYKDAAGKSQ